MKNSLQRIGLATALAGFIVLPAGISFSDNSKPFAKVGETTITEADLDAARTDYKDQLANMQAAQRDSLLKKVLIDLALMAEAAKAEGLNQSEDFKTRMKLAEIRALRNLYYLEKIDAAVSDEEVKAAYDEQVGSLPDKEQIRARHILVKTREDAEAIIADLDKGADFAETAREKSTGPSGPQGGDLGYFGRGQMVPAFEVAAYALEKGAHTSEPVKSQFGWHVIKLEDKRVEPKPGFEEVKDRLRQSVVSDKVREVETALKEKIKIERFDQ